MNAVNRAASNGDVRGLVSGIGKGAQGRMRCSADLSTTVVEGAGEMYAAHRHPIQVLSLQYSQSATDAANRNGMPHSLGIDLCDNLGQQAVATIGIEPSPFTVGVDLEKMVPVRPQ